MQKFVMLNVYFREQHSHSSRYGFCMALGGKNIIQVYFPKWTDRRLQFDLMDLSAGSSLDFIWAVWWILECLVFPHDY